MVSSGGDPMVFIPLKDAQEAQFLKDNDAIVNDRAAPPPTRPSTAPACPACWRPCRPPNQQPQRQCRAGAIAARLAPKRWPNPSPLEAPAGVHPRADGRDPGGQADCHLGAQIGMFLVILSIVSAAIVAFIIYTMTLGKIREIAVLKLIGTRNRTIAGMILQQALGLGADRLCGGQDRGHAVGAGVSQVRAAADPGRRASAWSVMLICALASTLAIRVALKVDPARPSDEAPLNLAVNGGIRIEGLRKVYGQGDTAVDALKNVNMQSRPARWWAWSGPRARARARCSNAWAPSSSPRRAA
jgi:putative ABC transport system permease protein